MPIATDTITLPSRWASFLVNGDESLFIDYPEDRELIAQECLELGINPCEFMCCSDESFFSHYNGVLDECLEYTYPVPDEPHYAGAVPGATWQIEVSWHNGWEKNLTKFVCTTAFDSFDPLMSEESCVRAAKMWCNYFLDRANREEREYHVSVTACPIGYPKELDGLDSVDYAGRLFN